MTDCDLKTSGFLFGNVHSRMEDVHTLWHHALDNYFDPQRFRASLQSCIIQLRSVTFLLQKNKDSIPDFDNWYKPWQDRMRSNALMRWAIDSRNIIEKQEDLETYSRISAKIVANLEQCSCVTKPCKPWHSFSQEKP
jgi:hypothetical protein